jgi:hypothetical protein
VEITVGVTANETVAVLSEFMAPVTKRYTTGIESDFRGFIEILLKDTLD